MLDLWVRYNNTEIKLINMKNNDILIPGGAGFIGRYFIDKLNNNNRLYIIDKKDRPDYIPNDIEYKKCDLTQKQNIRMFKNKDIIINLVSLVDVRESIKNTRKSYENNIFSLITVLQNMVEYNVSNIIYTSTSAIYGDELDLPVKENHPKDPVSDYGSSKLSAENLITTRSKIDGFDYHIFRLGNIVGQYGHGVIQDFITKLNDNPDKLEILGNGQQEKSYLFVEDCVSGIIQTYDSSKSGIYNLSSRDTINVNEIADIISDVMGINPSYSYTGGEKGWVGDVPKYKLDISKIESETEWSPSYTSSESVRQTAKDIIRDPEFNY